MAQVNGIILLDKPKGITSNSALQKVRYKLGADKAGHSGTLDPMATGLLPIGIGQGTKVLPYLLDGHKRYLAEVTLGSTTTTADAEGEVIETLPVPVLDISHIQSVISQFMGRVEQVPPMYSALKRDGRPLYELARAGITVERESRQITFFAIDLLSFEDNRILLQVWCSKGTYIRTLAEDIGAVLGCGAHLSMLRRLGVAGFDPISEPDARQWSWCPWELALDGQFEGYLLPLDVALRHLDAMTLEDAILIRLAQGQKISAQDVGFPIINEAPIRLYDAQGSFYGLGKATPYQGLMLERWMA
jgi:tRNA pseudouridine55 synthase